MNRLQDKTAFISGAAGSIGAATARSFVAEGARVLVSDIDAAGLDVAFANAGIFGTVADVADYPEDVFERVLAVNVRGPFHVASTRSMR